MTRVSMGLTSPTYPCRRKRWFSRTSYEAQSLVKGKGSLVILWLDDKVLVVVRIEELGICAPPSIVGLPFELHAQLFERLVS